MNRTLALQLDALQAADAGGCFRIRPRGPGRTARADRCPASLRAGDVLTVWKLDRLGRTLLDLVGLVEKPEGAGCRPQGADRGRGGDRHDKAGRADVLRHAGRIRGVRAGIDPGTDQGRDAVGEAPGPACRASAQTPRRINSTWRRSSSPGAGRNGRSPRRSAWPSRRCGKPCKRGNGKGRHDRQGEKNIASTPACGASCGCRRGGAAGPCAAGENVRPARRHGGQLALDAGKPLPGRVQDRGRSARG